MNIMNRLFPEVTEEEKELLKQLIKVTKEGKLHWYTNDKNHYRLSNSVNNYISITDNRNYDPEHTQSKDFGLYIDVTTNGITKIQNKSFFAVDCSLVLELCEAVKLKAIKSSGEVHYKDHIDFLKSIIFTVDPQPIKHPQKYLNSIGADGVLILEDKYVDKDSLMFEYTMADNIKSNPVIKLGDGKYISVVQLCIALEWLKETDIKVLDWNIESNSTSHVQKAIKNFTEPMDLYDFLLLLQDCKVEYNENYNFYAKKLTHFLKLK